VKKLSKFEVAYNALDRIESVPITNEAKVELKRTLDSATSLLAARAAEIIGNRGLTELVPDMITAFSRFMIDGARVDKLCSAKGAIVDALNKIEYMGDFVFLAGVRYIQMEPAFGKPVDTAIGLRCNCAFGLARIEHPDVHCILADLLVDKENAVCTAAAKALTYLGSVESELLLRLKVLTGDNESDVLSECFAGLMTMSPERSLDFVARYLRSLDASVVESAALAIGGSRIPQAYDVLRDCWDDNPAPDARRRLILPIALLRMDESFSFLLEIVRNSDKNIASEALSGLRIYAGDDNIKRIREAVKSRCDANMLKIFEAEFGEH
jgi:hypothetical protein